MLQNQEATTTTISKLFSLCRLDPFPITTQIKVTMRFIPQQPDHRSIRWQASEKIGTYRGSFLEAFCNIRIGQNPIAIPNISIPNRNMPHKCGG